MSNNKKIIILAVVIVGFIIIAWLVVNKNSYSGIEKKIEVKEFLYIPKVQPIVEANVIDHEDCSSLLNVKKKECLNEANFNKSFIEDNIFTCLDVDDYDKRSECIYKHVNFLEINLCDKIPDHKLYETCITDYANEFLDFEACDVFNNKPNEHKECIDRVKSFAFSQDFEGSSIEECGQIDTLEYKGLCLFNFLKTGNTSCLDIKNEELKNKCISQVLNSEAATIEACNKIPSDVYKKVCIIRVKNNSNEIDSDNDGIRDVKELWFEMNPFSADTDNDGLSDYEELFETHSSPVKKDTDNDGLSDYMENKKGTDIQRQDTDNDGILDGDDSDPLDKNNDFDGDGLSNEDEKKWKTDPNKKDTDNDGVSDYDEILNVTNPLGDGWQQDTDGDGLIDVDEKFYGTDIFNDDTDNDGLRDGDEIKNLTNPLGIGDLDFDNDGLSDRDELKYETNPSLKDTNKDGLDDKESIEQGIDAVSNDTDKDGLINVYEINKIKTDPFKYDTDGDGIGDGDEFQKHFTNPMKIDTDNDGLNDGDELKIYHTDPLKEDTDNDGYSDGAEIESGHNPLE